MGGSGEDSALRFDLAGLLITLMKESESLLSSAEELHDGVTVVVVVTMSKFVTAVFAALLPICRLD